jgi:hypothetical protein
MKLKSENLFKSDEKKLIAFWTNRGKGNRGNNNCTLFVVDADVPRRECVEHQMELPYDATATTLSWRNNVLLPRHICAKLGIDKNDIYIE